jgi:hypothetical protein
VIVRLTLVNQDPGAQSAPLHDALTSLSLDIDDSRHRTDDDAAWAWVDVSVLAPSDAMAILREIDRLGQKVLVEVVS